tara:strand:- start:149 stop:1150 length:1002 start_codon:yes stop_codon:yes gene_type:complete
MKSPLKKEKKLNLLYDSYHTYDKWRMPYDPRTAPDLYNPGRDTPYDVTSIDPMGLQQLPTNINENVFQLSRLAEEDMNAFSPTTSGPGFGARLAASGENFGANMMTPQAMTGVASGIGGIIQGLVGRTKRRNQQNAAQNQYDDMLAKYRDLDTSNLYADIENPYANIQTNFENVFEDLTVNQQQAEFQRQTLARQQAGLMQGLSGAAGGSGIAALAQALANQGQIGAQRISASIGQQEAMNQRLLAQGAARKQALERQAELQIAKGQAMTDQLRLRGAEQARALDYRKTGTELGMAQQDLAAKNMAVARGDAALYGGIGSLVGTGLSAAIGAV